MPRAVAPGAFLFSHHLRARMTDEDIAMTVRELRAALASMEASSKVQVVLFKEAVRIHLGPEITAQRMKNYILHIAR
jgi:hypothetical protein